MGGRGQDPVDTLKKLQAQGRFPYTSDPAVWTPLPYLSPGDVVLFSPCTIHSSPPSSGEMLGFICPAYAPGESRPSKRQNAGAPCRSCNRRVPLHQEIAGSKD